MYPNANNPYLNEHNQKSALTIDFEKFDKEVISNIHEHNKEIPLVSVTVTGRPMVFNNVYETSHAVISAWLPGTAGGDGIVNALTGKYRFRSGGESDRRNTLAFDWPKTTVSFVFMIGITQKLPHLRGQRLDPQNKRPPLPLRLRPLHSLPGVLAPPLATMIKYCLIPADGSFFLYFLIQNNKNVNIIVLS